MANMRLATGTAADALAAILARLDADAGPGTIKIYDGTQPASGGDALSGQVLLATLTLGDPAGSISGRTLTLNAITQDSSADANGTASWARIADNSGDSVFDCDVGTSGATINLSSVNIVQNGPVSITSFTITG